jgi:hypothetical protein
MPKPPKSPPDSLTEGVHRDRRDNVDAAIDAGQDTRDLALARDEASGRPDYSGERPADDRANRP